MNGLFHKITECCIKYGVIKTTEKLLQSPNNAQMFGRLTDQ